MSRIYSLPALLLVLGLMITSCKKDDPEITNPEELITTVNYTLSPMSGGNDVVLSFQDLDGDGGNDPIITGGTLAANESYNASIELLNEAEAPTEDITLEVQEEAEDHQLFFISDISDVNIAYNDQDANSQPVGLSTTLTTGSAATGTLTIILRHEPNKSATGVSNGDITNAGGETDIEVTIPIEIQ